MARGQLFYQTMRNPNAQHVWERFEFPVYDPNLNGHCERWFAARCTLKKPYCFTPSEAFYFGGKRYIPLYPCIAFATLNFGFIIQRLWDSQTWGRE